MVLTKKLALCQLINSPHPPVPLDHPNPQPSKLARLPVLLPYLAGWLPRIKDFETQQHVNARNI